jgi:membrane protease YdiL (CAAX protease family)
VAEEIVFRGAILRVLLDEQERRNGSLTTKGMWLAIAISALIFGVVHLNPAQIPHAFLIGLLLGWVYARTRSIIPGTVIHIVNNTATYLLAVAYINTPDITLSQILGGSQKYVWMSLLFSLCLLLPALFQLNLRMRKQ